MIKIRLQVLLNEIDRFIENFKGLYHVFSGYENFKNRNSECVRVYLDIELGGK